MKKALFWCWIALASAACSELHSQGEQCVFNDDCTSPLVCAGHRCRAQCRSGRDCAPGTVCIPSESPLRDVCVPARESSICAADGQCPTGALCLDNACWWSCRDNATCTRRMADACRLPPGLCALPVTAQTQSEMPQLLPLPRLVGPEDAPPADAADDVSSSPDAPPDVVPPPDAQPDVVSSPDAPPDVVPPPDAPPDVATDGASDASADAAVTDVATADGAMDASAMDVSSADARADATSEPGPVTCRDGADCALPNASGRCTSGLCVVASCTSGYTDCNRQPSDGCEVRTSTDVVNCGACGFRCPPVAHTTVSCASGMCIPSGCESGFADCDGDPANGCEVELATDARHCGGCGQTCYRDHVAAAACAMGRCTITRCSTGWGDCDRTGVPSDARTPTAEFANGCEVSTSDDARDCGACGNRCDTTSGRCVSGSCTNDRVLGWVAAPTSSMRELALAPMAGMSPTVITVAGGTYNLERFVVPAGVELRVSGSGFLDLRVLGEARIDGVVNVSGGRGGDSTPLADTTGRLGGGGGTGTVVDGAPASSPSCTAVGGGGGSGGEPGEWAVGAHTCGGPGNLGGGAAGVPGLGGSGGGGRAAGSGGAARGSDGGDGGGGVAGGGVGAGTGGGNPGQVSISGAPHTAGYGGTITLGAMSCGAGCGGGGSIGTAAALDQLAATEVVAGSGGGGGGGVMASAGAGGGGGGGVFRLSSATRITLSGTILARGGAGGNVTSDASTGGGAGGGGSGGLVVLVAPGITLGPGATVSVRGGAGGRVTLGAGTACGAIAGSGGFGRVVLRTRCATFTRLGSFDPPLTNCVAATAVAPLATGTPPRTYVVDYP